MSLRAMFSRSFAAKPSSSWVQWASPAAAADLSYSCKLRPPQHIPCVVLSKKLADDGAVVKAGEEVGVLEWAEMHPFLPVHHREVIVAPNDGRVKVNTEDRALLPYDFKKQRADDYEYLVMLLESDKPAAPSKAPSQSAW